MVEGVITSYDPLPKEGIILADEATFTFGKRDYVSKDKRLIVGTKVRFTSSDNQALNVEFLETSDLLPRRSRKWSIFMALIFGGSFGLHKMYLGKNRAASLMFMVSFIGLFLKGIPTGFMALISVCEGFKYFSLTNDEFKDTYVVGTKEWF